MTELRFICRNNWDTGVWHLSRLPKTTRLNSWPISRMEGAVFPITSAKMQSDRLRLDGATGCSAIHLKELTPVPWSIQWLKWTKSIIWIYINTWSICWSSFRECPCRMMNLQNWFHGMMKFRVSVPVQCRVKRLHF